MNSKSPKSRTVSFELGTSNSDIYAVPEKRYQTDVVSIVISNAVSADRKFSLDWYDEDTATWYTLAESTPIVGNGVVQFENTLWLRNGDKIRGLADAASSVTVTIKVQEYFIPLQFQ